MPTKIIEAAERIIAGECWADVLNGHTPHEVTQVADMLEMMGADDTAICLNEWC